MNEVMTQEPGSLVVNCAALKLSHNHLLHQQDVGSVGLEVDLKKTFSRSGRRELNLNPLARNKRSLLNLITPSGFVLDFDLLWRDLPYRCLSLTQQGRFSHLIQFWRGYKRAHYLI